MNGAVQIRTKCREKPKQRFRPALSYRGPGRSCRGLRGPRPQRIAYNNCRNRHCLKCQGAAAGAWLAEREAELQVGYFHVVFTALAEVADIAFHNKSVVDNLPAVVSPAVLRGTERLLSDRIAMLEFGDRIVKPFVPVFSNPGLQGFGSWLVRGIIIA